MSDDPEILIDEGPENPSGRDLHANSEAITYPQLDTGIYKLVPPSSHKRSFDVITTLTNGSEDEIDRANNIIIENAGVDGTIGVINSQEFSLLTKKEVVIFKCASEVEGLFLARDSRSRTPERLELVLSQVKRLVEGTNINMETADFQKLCYLAIEKTILRGTNYQDEFIDVSTVNRVAEALGVPIDQERVKQSIANALANRCSWGKDERVFQQSSTFGKMMSFYQSEFNLGEDYSRAISKKVYESYFVDFNPDNLRRIPSLISGGLFNKEILNDPDLNQLASNVVVRLISYPRGLGTALKIADSLGLDTKSDQFKEAAIERLKRGLSDENGIFYELDVVTIKDLIEGFGLGKKDIPEKMRTALGKLALERTAENTTEETASALIIINDKIELGFEQIRNNIFTVFGIDETQLADFVNENPGFIKLIIKKGSMNLRKKDLDNMVNLPEGFRDLVSLELTVDGAFNLDEQPTKDEDFDRLYNILKEEHPKWKHQTMCEKFEDGAKIFGFKRMFEYIGKEGVTQHDALHVFSKVITLYEASGLNPDDFWRNILDQVKNDNNLYVDSGKSLNAYQQLNVIAQKIDTNFNRLERLAELISDEDGVAEILEMLTNTKQIFLSWQSLMEYSEKVQVLDKIKEIDADFEEYPANSNLARLYRLSQTPQVGDELLRSLKHLQMLDFYEHVEPIMEAQGDAAFLYFKSIKSIRTELSSSDVDYIVYVGKKYGTKSRNILESILSKVDSISSERETVETFVSEFGVVDFNLYKEYKKLGQLGDQEGITHLKETVHQLQDKIYAGEMAESDFDNPLYEAVSYYTFPPAVGLTQEQYARLNKKRPDRRNDVPEELENLQYTQIELATGRYFLGEDKELNLENWILFGNVVKEVNKELDKDGKVEMDEVKVAEQLIDLYKKGGPTTKEQKKILYESMYRFHLNHGGGRLDEGYQTTLEGLMGYKEFIGERIKNNLIKDCLATYAKEHPAEMNELVADVGNKVKKQVDANIGIVKNMLKGIKRANDDALRQKAIGKLDDFLKDYGLSYEQIRGQSVDKYRHILMVDQGLTPEELVYRKLSSDLVSGINRSMRKEVEKFEFLESTAVAESLKLDFVVSKKKEHGVAGYTMGVCVTPDEKLWADPLFWNGILFDSETGQSMGGLHFIVREDCLVLPGINPSIDLLAKVDHEQLFDAIIAKAKEVKAALGLKKLLIPEDPVIHSNRTQIQEVIRKKNYPSYAFDKSQAFSYAPHQYSFQNMFEIE